MPDPDEANFQENTDVLIKVDDLTKTYKVKGTKVAAIQEISLKINRGEIVALVGVSGSGKSTLLQLIGGLDKPTSGTVTVHGQLLSKMSDRDLSKFRNLTIGFIFQSFYLQPFLTLEKNIAIATIPLRMKKSERVAQLDKLAKRVGLTDRLKHRSSQLSGGQIQRAAIARALMNSPQILLADEPTGNLDTANSQEVIELFKDIRDEFGTTIVIATHDNEIAQMADRIITIRDGRIA